MFGLVNFISYVKINPVKRCLWHLWVWRNLRWIVSNSISFRGKCGLLQTNVTSATSLIGRVCDDIGLSKINYTFVVPAVLISSLKATWHNRNSSLISISTLVSALVIGTSLIVASLGTLRPWLQPYETYPFLPGQSNNLVSLSISAHQPQLSLRCCLPTHSTALVIQLFTTPPQIRTILNMTSDSPSIYQPLYCLFCLICFQSHSSQNACLTTPLVEFIICVSFLIMNKWNEKDYRCVQ